MNVTNWRLKFALRPRITTDGEYFVWLEKILVRTVNGKEEVKLYNKKEV